MMQQMQQLHGNRAVQRFVQRSARGKAPVPGEDIGGSILAASGRGRSLDMSVQRRLEQGLGTDLSGVRIHTDGEADRLSRAVNADAFTTGSDIFFRSGMYNPESSAGLHLLAHESVHTVQQAQGPVAGTPTESGVSISNPSDSFEQSAEQAASRMTTGTPASGGPLAGPVQREAGHSVAAKPTVQRAEHKAPPEEEEETLKKARDKSDVNSAALDSGTTVQMQDDSDPVVQRGWRNDLYEGISDAASGAATAVVDWLTTPSGPTWVPDKHVVPDFILDKSTPKRSNTESSTQNSSRPTFTGEPAVDTTDKVWRFQVNSVESKGKIQIVYYTEDHYPAPTPTDDSGPLTNVKKGNWKKIVKDLKKNRTGIGGKWSAYRAEDLHEDYHWSVEWQGEVKPQVEQAENDIAKLQVDFKAAPTAAAANAELAPKATKIFEEAMKKARAAYDALGDSPGDPPYLAQAPAIDALVKRIEDHASDKGW
jgi:hypothetical protein